MCIYTIRHLYGYMCIYYTHVQLPCIKKAPPTSKSRPKGANRNPALILGFLYPTKQIPLREFAST